jgi:drug/metabolite transporter (DMT)-like permease
MLLGGLAALPLAFTGFLELSEPLSSVEWGSVSAASWTAVAYTMVLCSSFAIAAWQVNVSKLGANKVLVYLYLVTLIGLIVSVVLLGEGLGVGKIAGVHCNYNTKLQQASPVRSVACNSNTLPRQPGPLLLANKQIRGHS